LPQDPLGLIYRDLHSGFIADVPRGSVVAGRTLVAERGALAVVPFDGISRDPETDYFSGGLTEELTARLSTLSEIELVSRWATKQLKERKHDVRDIGSELGARYITPFARGAKRSRPAPMIR